uniref:Probable ATP-dependent RNA helicase spindle-E n=2 Tax=Lutzomyia longipalpis TaxID=7200 RepID=A0A1B0CMA6_LUTLO
MILKGLPWKGYDDVIEHTPSKKKFCAEKCGEKGEKDGFDGLFNPNKKVERRPIVAGGRVNTYLEKEVESRPKPPDNRSYAEKFQENELLAMRHVKEEDDFMDEEVGSSINEPVQDNTNAGIYSKYKFNVSNTPRLPIQAYRREILQTIEQHRVVVIEGATGCGKTTQVPQYIMEDAFAKKKYFNVIVTQPRRLAAISVAKRVAQEREWVVGDIVGFKIGRKQEVGEDTRITFCTTGVLLEKLVKTQNLEEFTHIILDEVHERDIDMDFLLILIRKFLYRARCPVKVILMSATIKSEKFASYFTIDHPIPVVNLSKSSPYQVKEYYIDDIERLGTSTEIFPNAPDITHEMYEFAAKLIFALDKIEKKSVAEAEGASSSTPQIGKSILVFLPGLNEINSLHRALDNYCEKGPDFKYEIIPLHSSLTYEEQHRAFRHYDVNTRKIILSTNIAESSITVPDVKYVIDFCLTKNLCVDSTTGFSTLKLEWASQDNCTQRAGRAGRVMDGRVYRLVKKDFYFKVLPPHITPEMLRQSLEMVVLKSKLIEMGPPETVLALALDPPLKSDVHNAILVLKELGGLLSTVNGEFVLNDGDMTFLGHVMASLPVDIRVARLIVLGYAFSVVDEMTIIGACLSVQGVFTENYKKEMSTYAAKLSWANGTGSDLIALLNVYKVYTERIRQNQMRYETMWADRCGVQIRMLREVVTLVQELQYRLEYFNVKAIPMPHGVTMNDYERCIIIKTVFAGAFYPNFAAYGANDGDKEKETFRITNGRNPANTVILTGLPNKYIGPLYRKTIREIFAPCVDVSTRIEVNFDHSERIYVSFFPNRSAIDSQSATYLTDMNAEQEVLGNVLLEVYKSVKYGQIRHNHRIHVLNPGKAETYAVERGAGEVVNGAFRWKRHDELRRDYVVYPRKNHIAGRLMHVVHLHKFFIQPDEELPYEEHIRTLLNTNRNLDVVRKEHLKVGMMVAATRKFGNHAYYARARVIGNDINAKTVEVYYVDFGNTAELTMTHIRLIKQGTYVNECPIEKLPPRLLECRLACLTPTAISSVRGRWTVSTIKELTEKMRPPVDVAIDVYAFVDGVAYVTLYYEHENINEWVIAKQLAQYTDENFMVKFDHDQRVNCEKLNHEYLLDDVQVDVMVRPQEAEVAPPPENICDREITLKGPSSPLTALIYSPTRSASKKVCKVERNSVNCVLLDNDFQDYHQKMVVATHIKKSASGELSLLNTTIMPNIPGILPLMALIFCPTAEFCRNVDNTRFISILTGLGTKPGTKVPMFEEHDMQIPLDVKIDHDDIECINQLRYSISTLLLLRTGQNIPELDNNVRYKLLQKIKDLTISIVTRRRPLCERKYPPKPFVWNQCDIKPSELLVIDDVYNGASIFPFLTSVKLDVNVKSEEGGRLKKNCQDLYTIAGINRLERGGIKCQLCDTYLNDISQVRLHLFTKLHRDREKEIKFEVATH